MKSCKTGAFLAALSLAACIVSTGRANGRPKLAPDLTARCVFTVSSNSKEKSNLIDGDHGTSWTASSAKGQYILVSLPERSSVSGIYIMWNTVPGGWSMEASENGDGWRSIELDEKTDFINTFIPVDIGIRRLRIKADGSWKLSVAEIRVFGVGELPLDVQVWKSSPEKADLMVIPAHPDDEFIYFGGTLPYYAGQLKKHTVVIYMTSSPIVRKFEALNGLWKAGVREYPVFLPLANKYTSTVEEAELAWDGLDHTVALLAEQIRRFKPDVVVTHDLGGEYGHGAHKLTALAVTKAVDACPDADCFPDSAAKYGSWQVKKCYLHLYTKGKAKMDWKVALPAFNGKTALDMAKACYDLHVSQHFRERPILDSGEYDNSTFGLYRTTVGGDILRNDLFEHVVPASSTVQVTRPAPTASPAPTPYPSPSERSEEAVEAISSDLRRNADGELSIRVFLAFGAITMIIMLLLAYRHYDSKNGTQPMFSKPSRSRSRTSNGA